MISNATILDADSRGSHHESHSFSKQWNRGVLVLAISAIACAIALALVWRIYQPKSEYSARVKAHQTLALEASQIHSQAQTMLYLQQSLLRTYLVDGASTLQSNPVLLQQMRSTMALLESKVTTANRVFTDLCTAKYTANATSAQRMNVVEADLQKLIPQAALVAQHYRQLLTALGNQTQASLVTDLFDAHIKRSGQDLTDSAQTLAKDTHALSNEMIDHATKIDQWLLIAAMLSIFGALVWNGIQLLFLGQSLRSNSKMHHEMQQLASVDPLTGILNRRGFKQTLGQLSSTLGHNSRVNDAQDTILMVIDLDHFKIFNDTYGHLAGDEHLKLCAQRWRTCLRASDVLARMGGEEFVLFMSGCNEAQAEQKFQQLLDVMPVGSSFSAGIALGLTDDSFESWYLRADRALYRAKMKGRGRAILASENEAEPAGV